jgi:hypothetical protein
LGGGDSDVVADKSIKASSEWTSVTAWLMADDLPGEVPSTTELLDEAGIGGNVGRMGFNVDGSSRMLEWKDRHCLSYLLPRIGRPLHLMYKYTLLDSCISSHHTEY